MRRAIIAMLVGFSSAVCVLAVVLLVRSFTWGEYFGVSLIDAQPDRYLLRHVFLQSNSGYLTLVFRRQSAENRRAADELRQTIHRYNKGRPPRPRMVGEVAGGAGAAAVHPQLAGV